MRTRTPLICITGHRSVRNGSAEVVVKEKYFNAVRIAGGVPVVLAPVGDDAQIAALLDHVDGVLLTGGNDIDPKIFGERVLNDTVHIDEDRDAFELPLARLAYERDVPVLAICRGIQVLNVALGGTLWQDIPAQIHGALPHRQHAPMEAVTHDVWVAGHSRLAAAIGFEESKALPTNTSHHQSIHRVAPCLSPTAYSQDGVIEAVEAHDRRFVLGVQWHPESLVEGWSEHRRLFEELVEAARVHDYQASQVSVGAPVGAAAVRELATAIT